MRLLRTVRIVCGLLLISGCQQRAGDSGAPKSPPVLIDADHLPGERDFTVQVEPADLACDADADCATVLLRCQSNCSPSAVRADKVTTYTALRDKTCQGYRGPSMSCGAPLERAVCSNRICTTVLPPARLDEATVLGLAERHLAQSGHDPADFGTPSMRFDPQDGIWDVDFGSEIAGHLERMKTRGRDEAYSVSVVDSNRAAHLSTYLKVAP